MATVELDPQQLLIGGEWVPASSGRAWDSSGPVDGVGATPVAAAGPEDVARAAEAAQAAFPAWSNTPPGERRALLNRAADLLQERSEQIAAGRSCCRGRHRSWSGSCPSGCSSTLSTTTSGASTRASSMWATWTGSSWGTSFQR